MVEELVRTLKAQGTSLSGEEIERIVVTAVQRANDQQLSGASGDVTQNAAPAATGVTAHLGEPPPGPAH
jgi:hypothetical protein